MVAWRGRRSLEQPLAFHSIVSRAEPSLDVRRGPSASDTNYSSRVRRHPRKNRAPPTRGHCVPWLAVRLEELSWREIAPGQGALPRDRSTIHTNVSQGPTKALLWWKSRASPRRAPQRL